MQDLLTKVTQHAMNYAVRSGICMTTSFAISQAKRLLKTVNDRNDYKELHSLQERLESKIKIISPAIDLIELISARRNTTLESAVTLTKTLRWDIQSLGVRLEKAANAEESFSLINQRKKSRASHQNEIRQIINDIEKLIFRIEDAVPLINLAITTSGANLSTSLPSSVSPSRLLQASTLLTAGDSQYLINLGSPVQIGPIFTLSLYMLFAGHFLHLDHDENRARETTWKEVIHKARVKLMRSPINFSAADATQQHDGYAHRLGPSMVCSMENTKVPFIVGDRHENEFSYYLEIIEDLDDDRVHSQDDSETQPGPYGGVELAGIRETIPIYQIGKIFYADTGKILNINGSGEVNSPVLLLRRDSNAHPPRKMMHKNEAYDQSFDKTTPEESESEMDSETQDEVHLQLFRESSARPPKEEHESSAVNGPSLHLPADLDPEWLAFEVYKETEVTDSEDDQELNADLNLSSRQPSPNRDHISSNVLAEKISAVSITTHSSPSPSPSSSSSKQITPEKISQNPVALNQDPLSPFVHIRTSLSLLEMLIRLTSLQQFQQASHLSIPDELLNFFLEESSTTGAGVNDEERKRTRREALRKVGFDPYNESPIKRRGEEYQRNYGDISYNEDESPYGENKNQFAYSNWSKNRKNTPESLLPLLSFSKRSTPDNFPSSPLSSYGSQKKPKAHLSKPQNKKTGSLAQSSLKEGVPLHADPLVKSLSSPIL